MKFALDRYASLDSPIHRWETRCKLVGLMALAFAIAAVDVLVLLPAVLAIAFSCYALARLPLAYWWRRVRYPGFFLVALVAALPFAAGDTVLWAWGPVRVYREGCLAVLPIAGRFAAILTLGLVAFGTHPVAETVRALRSLGLSPILTDLMLLSYRYLTELGDDWQRMQVAVQLRGFRNRRLDGQTLRLWAALTGSLLVRSYERSERVYQAMRLRGYGAPAGDRPRKLPDRRAFFSPSALGLYGALAVAVGLAIAQFVLSRAG